jgi:hypothetical protein
MFDWPNVKQFGLSEKTATAPQHCCNDDQPDPGSFGRVKFNNRFGLSGIGLPWIFVVRSHASKLTLSIIGLVQKRLVSLRNASAVYGRCSGQQIITGFRRHWKLKIIFIAG